MAREIVKELDDEFHVFSYRRMVAWNDCPHLLTPDNLAFRKALIKKYGPDSSFIRSFLDGRFQRDTDENFVFQEFDLDLLAKTMNRQDIKPIHGRMRGAGDFSGGGDKQVLRIANGTEEVLRDEQNTSDTDWLAKHWVKLLKENGVEPPDFYGDSGGLGKPIIDNMESLDYRGVHRYMNNQLPRNEREFKDRITEDHYTFKVFLKSAPVVLLRDTVLMKQARQRRFTMTSHNQIKLEDKKAQKQRTGESPDHLETLIMLFADFMPPAPPKPKDYRSKLEDKAAAMRGPGCFPNLHKQVVTGLRPAR